jgi:hypothetical protein
LAHSLSEKAQSLPFVKREQQVHLVLFLKRTPEHPEAARYFLPENIVSSHAFRRE